MSQGFSGSGWSSSGTHVLRLSGVGSSGSPDAIHLAPFTAHEVVLAIDNLVMDSVGVGGTHIDQLVLSGRSAHFDGIGSVGAIDFTGGGSLDDPDVWPLGINCTPAHFITPPCN